MIEYQRARDRKEHNFNASKGVCARAAACGVTHARCVTCNALYLPTHPLTLTVTSDCVPMGRIALHRCSVTVAARYLPPVFFMSPSRTMRSSVGRTVPAFNPVSSPISRGVMPSGAPRKASRIRRRVSLRRSSLASPQWTSGKCLYQTSRLVVVLLRRGHVRRG
jgi:hypothetical protein